MDFDQIVSKTLWVGNLHSSVTIDHISELFYQAGPILFCLFDKNALVIFKHAVSVHESIQLFHRTTLYGLPIILEKYSEYVDASVSQKEIMYHFQKLGDSFNNYQSCRDNNKSELDSQISENIFINESVSNLSVESFSESHHCRQYRKSEHKNNRSPINELDHSKSNSIEISNNIEDSYKRKHQNDIVHESLSSIIAQRKKIRHDEQLLLPNEHNSTEDIFKVGDLREIINEKHQLLEYGYNNNGNVNAPCHRTRDYSIESNESYRQERNRCDNTENSRKRRHCRMSSSHQDNSSHQRQERNRCDNTVYSRKHRHSRMSSNHRDNSSHRRQERNRCDNIEYSCKHRHSRMSNSHRDNSSHRRQERNRCDNTEYSCKHRHSRMSNSHRDNSSYRRQERNRCDNTENSCKHRYSRMSSSHQDNSSHRRQKRNRCDKTVYSCKRCHSKMKSSSHLGSSRHPYN